MNVWNRFSDGFRSINKPSFNDIQFGHEMVFGVAHYK